MFLRGENNGKNPGVFLIILGNKTSENQLFNLIPESDDEPHAG
jgi:hypothetical protein